MNIPTTTPRQQQILKLLYRHRFLTRKHIQQYFGHKDKRRSTRWLKDLKNKQCIDWLYDADDPDSRSKPAIYFLDINGIRLLRTLHQYPEEELRKRYKDKLRQQDFIDRCLLLADCCLHLEARNKGADAHYAYALEADYGDPASEYAYLSGSELIRPALAFTKWLEPPHEPAVQTYFLDLLDPSTPRYMVGKKLNAYLEYLQTDEWKAASGDNAPPIVLIACPTLAELAYAKRFIRKQLKDAYDDEIPEQIKIRFTTIEKLKTSGLTAIIWEDV